MNCWTLQQSSHQFVGIPSDRVGSKKKETNNIYLTYLIKFKLILNNHKLNIPKIDLNMHKGAFIKIQPLIVFVQWHFQVHFFQSFFFIIFLFNIQATCSWTREDDLGKHPEYRNREGKFFDPSKKNWENVVCLFHYSQIWDRDEDGVDWHGELRI